MARIAADPGDPGLDEILVSRSSSPLIVADAATLFQGSYQRQGSDLVIESPDGRPVRIVDYFSADQTPDLYSEQGAVITADVVARLVGPQAPLSYAQAGTSAAAEQIGQVETLAGTAFATRANGQRVALQIGDPVFEDDLVETASDSTLGLTFIDQTVFSLSANARMILDELIYEPGGDGNSMVFNLVQGTFVFITGQVAPTGDMKIETPVATMGIRGTTPIVFIEGQNGNTEFGILKDPDGKVGEYILTDKITGETIRRIVDEGSIVLLDRVGGDPTEITVDAARLAERAEAQSNAYFLYSAARSRIDLEQRDGNTGDDATGNGPPSGPPGGDVGSSGLNGFKTNSPDSGPRGRQDAPPDDPNRPQAPPDFFEPIGFNPFVDTNIPPIAENLVFELSEDILIAEGELAADDPDGDDIVTYEIIEQPEFGFVFTNDDGTFTFISDPIFDLLGQGEAAALSFSYQAVDSQDAVSNAATVTIVVHGVNDAPEADPIIIASTDEDGSAFPFDLLSTAFDPDGNDDLDVENLTATSTNLERDVSFSIDNGSGQLTFDPRQFNDLADGEAETVTFEYDIVDNFGARISNTAEITITGKNDGPVTGDDGLFSVSSGATFNVDISTLLGNDFDPEGDAFDITAVFGAENGMVAFGTGSSIAFTAGGGLNTGDPAGFHYVATDSLGASSIGFVDFVIDNMGS